MGNLYLFILNNFKQLKSVFMGNLYYLVILKNCLLKTPLCPLFKKDQNKNVK